jgi:hypothetical protein
MNGRQLTGAALALAAASFFATLPATASQATEAGVHCYGINSCKGHNDCKTDKNACKGQGSCKGLGFLEKKSAEECTKAGGTVGQ